MACFIDLITPDGFIEGWARSEAGNEPCHVQIRLGDTVIAEAIANRFRLDLLQVRVGHGHYAFVARMREPLSPGSHPLVCYDGRTNTPFPYTSGELPVVPDRVPEKAHPFGLPVESLLVCPAAWDDEDVLAHISCLNLADNLARMGAARFVDVTYKFVLDRWADPDAARRYAQVLNDREIPPEEFVTILIRSEERKAIRTPLASPFDYRFPYAV